MKYKNMVWITTTIILFVLFVAPAFLASLIKMIPANDQPGYGDMGSLSVYGERDFKQVFVSKHDNLTAVATTIKNPNLKNKKDIIFNLYDMNDNLLRTTRLNGFNIGDGDFAKIIFEPIKTSKNQKYYFVISSPDATSQETIDLFLIKPTSEVIEYTYDEETKQGGIPMVTFHKPESKWQTIKSVYLNLFSKL